MKGDLVRVQYTSFLEGPEGRGSIDGFIETNRNSEALEFRVGEMIVLPAIDKGVENMAAGGLRMIVVPPNLVSESSWGMIVVFPSLVSESSDGSTQFCSRIEGDCCLYEHGKPIFGADDSWGMDGDCVL